VPSDLEGALGKGGQEGVVKEMGGCKCREMLIFTTASIRIEGRVKLVKGGGKIHETSKLRGESETSEGGKWTEGWEIYTRGEREKGWEVGTETQVFMLILA
jgi:hypothetical protein